MSNLGFFASAFAPGAPPAGGIGAREFRSGARIELDPGGNANTPGYDMSGGTPFTTFVVVRAVSGIANNHCILGASNAGVRSDYLEYRVQTGSTGTRWRINTNNRDGNFRTTSIDLMETGTDSVWAVTGDGTTRPRYHAKIGTEAWAHADANVWNTGSARPQNATEFYVGASGEGGNGCVMDLSVIAHAHGYECSDAEIEAITETADLDTLVNTTAGAGSLWIFDQDPISAVPDDGTFASAQNAQSGTSVSATNNTLFTRSATGPPAGGTGSRLMTGTDSIRMDIGEMHDFYGQEPHTWIIAARINAGISNNTYMLAGRDSVGSTATGSGTIRVRNSPQFGLYFDFQNGEHRTIDNVWADGVPFLCMVTTLNADTDVPRTHFIQEGGAWTHGNSPENYSGYGRPAPGAGGTYEIGYEYNGNNNVDLAVLACIRGIALSDAECEAITDVQHIYDLLEGQPGSPGAASEGFVWVLNQDPVSEIPDTGNAGCHEVSRVGTSSVGTVNPMIDSGDAPVLFRRTMQNMTGDPTTYPDWRLQDGVSGAGFIADAGGITRTGAPNNEDQLMFDELLPDEFFVQMVMTTQTRTGATVRTGPSLTRSDIYEYQSANVWIDATGPRYPRWDGASAAAGVNSYAGNGNGPDTTGAHEFTMAVLRENGHTYFYHDGVIYAHTDPQFRRGGGFRITETDTGNPYLPSRAGLLMRGGAEQRDGLRWHHMVAGDASLFNPAFSYDDYDALATEPIVSVQDSFDGYADAAYLDAQPHWNSNLTTGDRARIDGTSHTDTSPGVKVVDGSAAMAAEQYLVHVTRLETDDHEVELDCFPDLDETNGGNYVGVTARNATAGSYGVDCYCARFETVNGFLKLYQVVGGASTELGSVAFARSETTIFNLRLRCVGSSIQVFVDDVLSIDVTNTAIPTGKFSGIYFWRDQASPTGQPYFKNFRMKDAGITFVGSRNDNTMAEPVGTQEGDIVIAVPRSQYGGQTITPPAEYTAVRAWADLDVDTTEMGGVYYAVRGASPLSSDWAYSIGPVNPIMVAYRNVDPTAPVDVFNVNEAAEGATTTFPSVTTTVINTLLVGVLLQLDFNTVSDATWLEERVNGSYGRAHAWDDGPQPAVGPSGTNTVTNQYTFSGAVAVSIALRPPA